MKVSQDTQALALGYHATIREEHALDGLLVTNAGKASQSTRLVLYSE